MTNSTKRTFTSILEIKQANRASGHTFFEPGEMRGFGTRVHETIYGGRFFVTAEKFPHFHGNEEYPTRVTRYTVREADETGNISNVGDFGRFATRSGAHKAARRAANGEKF